MRNRFLSKSIADTSLQLALARNLLRDAVNLLGRGDEKFVCMALNTALGNDLDPVRRYVCTALRSEIMARIHPHPTVTTWLIHECGVADELLDGATARDYRILWCDDMIKELYE
jgi:hypothetical protein